MWFEVKLIVWVKQADNNYVRPSLFSYIFKHFSSKFFETENKENE